MGGDTFPAQSKKAEREQMNSIIAAMSEWANRDAWLTFAPEGDSAIGDYLHAGADCNEHAMSADICGCMVCDNCGVPADTACEIHNRA